MTDRFEHLHKLPDNLYVPGSPVIITAGELLKDAVTGKVIVQLKFKSVSKNIIKAIRVSITPFDILEKAMSEICEYQYLDLNVADGQYFGSDKAIIMPNNSTRSFSISKIQIVFLDKTVWESSKALFNIPAQLPLKTVFNDDELVKQYQLKVNNKAKYVPDTFESLWLCSCGSINNFTNCNDCGAEKMNVFSCYDIPKLREEMNARLVCENEENKQKITKRRNQKIFLIKSVCVLSILVSVVILASIFIPKIRTKITLYNQYMSAQEYAENHNYTEAISLLSKIKNYKNSESLITEYLYQNAKLMFENSKYEEALEEFVLLDGYQDSKEYAENCIEFLAKEYYEMGNFDKCIEMCSKHNYTSDFYFKSAYEKGKKHFESKEYRLALNYLNLSNEYMDSNDMILKSEQYLNYDEAVKKMRNGDLKEALNIFESLESFNESKSHAQICRKYIKYDGEWKNTSQISYYDKGDSNDFGALPSDDLTINICISEEHEVSITVQEYVLTSPQKLEKLTYSTTVNGSLLSWEVYSDKNDFNMETGKRIEESYHTKTVYSYSYPS